MFRIIIVSDSFQHFEVPIKEYCKRLGKNLEIIQIRPEKTEDPKVAIRRESERIAELLKKRKIRPIYLDFRGIEFSSEAFAEFLRKRLVSGTGGDFLIGGAYGIDSDFLGSEMDTRVSLGKMTFPHSMAFLVLLEQLYRTIQIEKGGNYHH